MSNREREHQPKQTSGCRLILASAVCKANPAVFKTSVLSSLTIGFMQVTPSFFGNIKPYLKGETEEWDIIIFTMILILVKTMHYHL